MKDSYKARCKCGNVRVQIRGTEVLVTSTNGSGWLYGQPISTGLAAACRDCGDKVPLVHIKFLTRVKKRKRSKR